MESNDAAHGARPAAAAHRRRRWRHYAAGLLAVGAAAGVAIVAVPWAGAAGAPAGGCAAVNIITARASTEQQGEGITGTLAQAIQSGSKQTVSRESVSYPASLADYNSSESQGVTNAEQELTTAVQKCPDQKQVLLGYSQGAQVVMDVIAGSGELFGGSHIAPVSTSISSHIAAVAQFGDPGHVVNEPWDQGSATQNGLFRRTSAQLQLLNTFGAAKIRGWCDSGDPFCAGGTDIAVHLAYVQRDQSAATTFVLNNIGG